MSAGEMRKKKVIEYNATTLIEIPISSALPSWSLYTNLFKFRRQILTSLSESYDVTGVSLINTKEQRSLSTL